MTRAEPADALREVPADPEALIDLSEAEGWGDGLPLVPPTPERVARLVAATGLDPGDSLGGLPPSWHHATVERVAACAAMAGCAPPHFPTLVAAVRAMAAQEFNLRGIQATTNPVAVGVVVCGPVCERIGLNTAQGCLGPGWRANACIGRAVRLVLLAIAGANPRDADGATHGSALKYTTCFGENTAASPWEPFHAARGFDAGASTATVFGLSGSLSVIESTPSADELVLTLGRSLHYPGSNDYIYDGEPLIVVGPEHARLLADAGMSRSDVQEALFEASFVPLDRFSSTMVEYQLSVREPAFRRRDGVTEVPASASPSGIHLVVAGGPSIHSTILPSYGVTRCTTEPIIDYDDD